MKTANTIISKKTSKIKQIIHAYIPLILLLILPHSFISLLVPALYSVIAGYFYIEKAMTMPVCYSEYFFANSAITLIFMALYVNAL